MKIFYFVFFLLLPFQLSAYIDPMSGSTILYVVAGFLAAVFYGLRGFFYRLVNLWQGRGFISKDSIDGCDVVFYSEGKQYWQVFKPVILALEKRNVKSAYLTSGEDDPGLNHQSEFTSTQYLGGMAQSWAYLNNLRAPVVIMTTPQIDIMTLKRSRWVKHYGHLLHSPTDIHSYRKYAFDYFDSIFCSGPFQVESIRKMEQFRNSPMKLLLETGLTYYDQLISEKNEAEKKSDGKSVVLVAPTWQPFCIVNRFGQSLFETLLDNKDFHVIFRPHPQSYISFPEVVKSMEDLFGDSENFEIDRKPSGSESLQRADVMITDVSGVAMDFAFLQNKPIVFFDVPFDGKGLEASNLDHQSWDLAIRNQLGALLQEDELDKLNEVLIHIIDNPLDEDLRKLREKNFYNWGSAGEKAAEQIVEIVEQIK